MRLNEIVRKRRFFHTSQAEFAPGQTIDATQRDSSNAMSSMFWEREERLEQHRPPNALPRNQSIFMTIDKPEYMWGNLAYEVEPLASVDRNDINWFEAMVVADEGLDDDDQDDPFEAEAQADEAAKGYWSGRPMSNRPWWEYRTSKVRIVSVIGRKK